MANTYTTSLRLILQEQFGNFETWGELANQMVELVEAAIAGVATINLSGGNVTLSTQNNLPDQSRNMVLVATGTIGANRTITVPSVTKVYLVKNDTSGAFTVTVKTSAGAGVEVPQGSMTLVICDGTDVLGSLTVTTAQNSLSLGGVLAANYAQLAVAQGWTAGQATNYVALTDAASIATDAALSNCFSVTLTANRTLADPTNMIDGQTIVWRIKQDGSGSHTLAYGSKFKFPEGTTPVLSTGAGDIDILTGIYHAGDDVIECVLTKNLS